jgi:hypothetical protein
MTTNATRMKYGFGLGWRCIIIFINVMPMARMTGLHYFVTRLMLVMAGCALCNAEIRMLLMRKRNCPHFAVKLDYLFIFRNRQALCGRAPDKH